MKLNILKEILKSNIRETCYNLICNFISKKFLMKIMLECDKEELFKTYKYSTAFTVVFGEDKDKHTIYIGTFEKVDENIILDYICVIKKDIYIKQSAKEYNNLIKLENI